MSRNLMSWMSISLAFGVLGQPPVRAQSLEEGLPTGTRVRVTLMSETDPAGTGPCLTGWLTEVRPGSIVLETTGYEERELQRDAILRLERSIRPSHKKRAALIGFGLGFGALAGFAAVGGSQGWCYNMGVAECAAGAAILALPIAAVSAIVAPGEQWAEVPLAVRSRGSAAGSAGPQLRLVPLVGRYNGLTVEVSF